MWTFPLVLLAVLAALPLNAADPVATLSENNRHAFVSLPIGCLEGTLLELQVSLNQSASGAQGEGYSQGVCAGGIQQWMIHATAHTRATFQAGPAQACLLASDSDHGFVNDMRQWCQTITLVASQKDAVAEEPDRWQGER